MKPRILIVENEFVQRAAIKRLLGRLSDEEKAVRGIDGLEVEEAEAKSQAIQFLGSATERCCPYDILLLDLGLPETPEDNTDDLQRGLDVLAYTRKRGAARAVIIVSVFTDYAYLTDIFRGGEVDFVGKRYEEDTLRTRILAAWDLVIAKRSNEILAERVKVLVPHAERGLAYVLGACFSEYAQTVRGQVDALSGHILERFGLDPARDADDPMVRALRAIQDAEKDARERWKQHQSGLGMTEDGPAPVVLEDLLARIAGETAPCLVDKRVNMDLPEEGRSVALSFQHDVELVLKEILLGGIVQLPDPGGKRRQATVRVTVGKSDDAGKWCVRFEEAMDPPSDRTIAEDETLRQINQGLAISPGGGFGRDWGLSIAQHVALRGGGCLCVGRDGAKGCNVVEYLVPVAQHEHGNGG